MHSTPTLHFWNLNSSVLFSEVCTSSEAALLISVDLAYSSPHVLEITGFCWAWLAPLSHVSLAYSLETWLARPYPFCGCVRGKEREQKHLNEASEGLRSECHVFPSPTYSWLKKVSLPSLKSRGEKYTMTRVRMYVLWGMYHTL